MSSRLFISIFFLVLLLGCGPEPINVTSRLDVIPQDAVKITPDMDLMPPILHSDEFENPVPLAVISTAGAEDSPFIYNDELYFVFVKDVREDVHVQIRDPANGIWKSEFKDGSWQDPELVVLQKPGKLALNGCTFVDKDFMLFCTAREGYTGMHWFSAQRKDSGWTDWKVSDFNSDYQVGELHIYGDELFYHSNRGGGSGGNDIWMLKNIDGKWQDPTNIKVINSEVDEGMPYISKDGKELWFNRWYQGSPAVFRSKKVGGEWQNPELVVSQFAGEPTLDKFGNLYFVHHYYNDSKMVEADIYVAYKK